MRFLTYNVWGVPFIGRLAKFRMPEIGRRLAGEAYDIVALQEAFEGIFTGNEAGPILEHAGYPYFVKGPRGKLKPVDSGLVLLSRHPIVESETHAFSTFTGTDALSRKGILLARIDVPGTGLIDVYNTHTNAGLTNRCNSVRTRQFAEIVAFVERHSGTSGNPVVFLGDLNVESRDECFKVISESLRLRDAYGEKGELPGLTLDPGKNANLIDADRHHSLRIDFVLAREGTRPFTTTLEIRGAHLRFNHDEFRGIPLSDHFGVEAELQFSER